MTPLLSMASKMLIMYPSGVFILSPSVVTGKGSCTVLEILYNLNRFILHLIKCYFVMFFSNRPK